LSKEGKNKNDSRFTLENKLNCREWERTKDRKTCRAFIAMAHRRIDMDMDRREHSHNNGDGLNRTC
jgi:hypothetical protein